MNEDISFEEAIRRLEEIIKKLESGSLPLEESITLYEQGVGLIRRCTGLLDGAERRITLLTKSRDPGREGEIEEHDFKPQTT